MFNQILDLSFKLIKVPSVKEKQEELKAVLGLAQQELQGFTLEYFEKNGVPSLLIYSSSIRPNRFRIILNGHLDVVPGDFEQFEPKIKKGRLYGRGAYDMKAASAVEILVFKELAKKLPYSLGLQLVLDEEIGGFNGTKYQIKKGVKADFVIGGEPTNFTISYEGKGVINGKIYIKGKSAHSAYPWRGDNALLKLYLIFNDILKFYPLPKRENWRTTINLARIETENTVFNRVPDKVTAFIDIRYIKEDLGKVVDVINKVCKKYKANFEVLVNEKPQFVDKSNFYIKTLQETVKKITRGKAKRIKTHGSSDMRHFNTVGISAVCFGPTGFGHHTSKEWVDIKSLEDYYLILKDFLSSI